MWILNWFKSTLESLGLVNKKAKIVFLGLDDAGKTTLLLRLKEDVMKQMDPTHQPYSEELTMGKITFKEWDLGGQKTWRKYVLDVDGIIYLVDSSNGSRFE
jgi:GTP-binding protein SAR1